jgi:hypothetical protein
MVPQATPMAAPPAETIAGRMVTNLCCWFNRLENAAMGSDGWFGIIVSIVFYFFPFNKNRILLYVILFVILIKIN